LPDFLAEENFIARLYKESLCAYREPLSQLPGNLHNAHLEPKISVVLPLVMWRQTVTMFTTPCPNWLCWLRHAGWCCRSNALGNQHTTWTFHPPN